MADYRKRVDPPAQYKNMLGDRSEKPLSVQMAEVGVEFTPAGTIFGLNDIKEELQKEKPRLLQSRNDGWFRSYRPYPWFR